MSVTKYTKRTLIAALKEIRNLGWIKNHRNINNDGAIGNTLEDLLGISENNLPLPNAAEWELKTQKRDTSALLTLFHLEPSPRALHIVDYLLLNYGWKHKEAGKKYPQNEKSFRQTLSYRRPTLRGFYGVKLENIFIDFDARTGHNHGTKFRIIQNAIPFLYNKIERI